MSGVEEDEELGSDEDEEDNSRLVSIYSSGLHMHIYLKWKSKNTDWIYISVHEVSEHVLSSFSKNKSES